MINELGFLVADIDGTLVNEPREMMELTKKVLTDLHRRGIRLGIASGRPLGEHLYSLPAFWGLDFQFDCYIGMNGGQLYDFEKDQYSEFYKLEPEVIRDVVELMDASGIDANPFIYIGEDMLSRERDAMMEAAMKRHGIQCDVINNISDLYRTSNAKILFRLRDAKDMPALEAYLAEHRSDRFAFFKTQPTMMEFQDSRVSKAVAMLAYCRENSIPVDTVMAFGDMTNDNEMLKEAGWSVCLKQGSDDTKACADAVTEYTNDEDGFGHYMIDHWYIPKGWKIPD
ncbi:MAG: HAD family hydrolase [Solobacterium sp.]|nr:HAD family hydrolase [Solobacterium sp.]